MRLVRAVKKRSRRSSKVAAVVGRGDPAQLKDEFAAACGQLGIPVVPTAGSPAARSWSATPTRQ